MGRPKKAISIIRRQIEEMRISEEWWKIRGMIKMAREMGHISIMEDLELTRELDSKQEELRGA